MPLSDTWLRSNQGRERERLLEKTDRDGLGVRASPKGKITFQMRYRYDGKPRRLDLGSYPSMTLKQARDENTRLRGELEQGLDPKVVRQLEKQTILSATTLEALFSLWYESYLKKNKKNHLLIKRSFEIHVLTKIGTLPAADVSLHEWLHILESLADSIPAIAERILTNSKQMLKWAVKRRLIESNSLADINAAEDLSVKKNVRTRNLNDIEIAEIWMAIEQSRMAQKNKLFLQLCLFFGCRNGELRHSKKAHFDLNTMLWTIPPENHKLGSKTGKPLLRPIIPEIIPLIQQAQLLSPGSLYLFTNAGSGKMMGKGAPLSLPYNIMQWLRKNQGIEMVHWTVHDLRKTARTNWSTLTDPHIAEIMLGHKLPGEWQTYDHHLYLDEQAEAYLKWWNRLMKITQAHSITN